MNFKEAIVTHSKWKKTLSDYLQNPDGSLNPEVLCKDNNCTLGLWIYGEAADLCHGNPDYEVLKQDHINLHLAAADVVTQIHEKSSLSEDDLIGPASRFGLVSQKVVKILEKFDRDFKLENRLNETIEELDVQKSKWLLKQLLDNIGDGFVSVHSDGLMNAEFSRAAEEMLLYSPKGKKFSHLFGEDIRANVEEALELIFSATMVFESLAPLLPRVHFLNLRFIEFSYRPIYESGKLTDILVIMKDVTRLQNAEKKAALEAQTHSALIKILSHPADFHSVLDEVDRFQNMPFLPAEILRVLHTLKGAFGIFGMNEFVQLCHDWESKLKLELSLELFEKAKKDLRFRLDKFLSNYSSVLKLEQKSEKTVSVRQAKIQSFLQEFQKVQATSALAKAVDELFSVPLAESLSFLDQIAQATAEKLGKKVELIWDKEFSLNPIGLDSLFLSFAHLIKNSIDHGIEEIESRIASGKTETGRIWITANNEQDFVHFQFKDDGAGINVTKLRQKALEKFPNRDLTDEQVHNLIFVPGISSKDQVTEHSGRGIGMDAVRIEARKLGGEAWVVSSSGKGTIVEIKVPLKR